MAKSTESSFPDGFDPTSCVLFLGSGFSREATNALGENLPIGRGLEKELLKCLQLPEESDYDLKDLATHALSSDLDLHDLLTDLFTITSLTEDQQIILGQDWRRIYTTNYDDAAEWHNINAKVKPRPKSYSLEDALPSKIRPKEIMHLHGYIHRCTKENVFSQLILSHYSYAEQAAMKSPWWDQFERDLRTAEGIFFVGYSLSDFAVASYLTESAELAKKCHFILCPDPDPVLKSRIADYGLLHAIAVRGFADKCKATVSRQELTHPNALAAFRYFDTHKDNKPSIKPTPIEIDALMTLGNFKLQRLLATFPETSYVIPRPSALDQALAYLEANPTLILHSKIGNGKSIFRQCLSMRLSELGYACFVCRDDVTIPERDVDFLRSQKKPAIIFPNYDTAIATLSDLTGLPETTRYIVEINTGTLQVRSTEVMKRLEGPVARLNLNNLAQQDIDDLQVLLDDAGISPPNMKTRFSAGAEMRDIVLSLYENQEVARKIKSLVDPLFADSEFKRVLCCSIILKSLGITVDPGYFRKVTNVDGFHVLARFDESAHEILTIDLDRMEAHSAVFSDYLIHQHIDPNDLCDWIYNLGAEAARRRADEHDLNSKRSRDARHMLGSLFRYSKLKYFLRRHNSRDLDIGNLYERARDNDNINAEPLFWLQYSIFMQVQENWDMAEKHMATAYTRAAQLAGFKTYQLDTNSLGLLLKLEIHNVGSAFVPRIEIILERIDKVHDMLSDGNHRYHALSVLAGIEEFLRVRRDALSTSEATRLTYQLNLLIDQLDQFDIAVKMDTGSDQTKGSLKRAVNLLTT